MGLPSSVVVGRARSSVYSECLGILKKVSSEDPFTNWLSTSERVRVRYLRYVLSSGFRTGWVALGRPRAGVCVATPIRTAADPCVWWAWLRFWMAASDEHRAGLQEVATTVRQQAATRGTLIWYLGIVRRFRGGSLPLRLAACALPDEEAAPVFVQTAKPAVARVLARTGGNEVARVSLPSKILALRLYRIAGQHVNRLRRFR